LFQNAGFGVVVSNKIESRTEYQDSKLAPKRNSLLALNDERHRMLALRWLRLFLICVLLASPGSVLSAIATDAPAPGAKTPTNSDSKARAEARPEDKFRVVLPDGATFELVGVGESLANDKAWWNGDGSARAKPRRVIHFENQTPFSKKDTNLLSRLFVFECMYKGDASVAEPAFVGETKESSAGSWSPAFLGMKQMESTLSVEVLPQSRAAVRLKYAAGKWTTVATCPATRGTAVMLPQGGVLFGDPVEKDGNVQLPVAVKADPDNFRTIAIDQSSHEHQSSVGVSTSIEGIQLISLRFPNLRLARVKEFRLQMRTWRQIEFRNISLHRGQKTNFAIFIDDKPSVRSR
jgi:hypothetical protein